jgi:D-alanyl-D-alanine carboxypeptidase
VKCTVPALLALVTVPLLAAPAGGAAAQAMFQAATGTVATASAVEVYAPARGRPWHTLRSDTAALRAVVQARLDSLRATGSFPGVSAAITFADGRSIAVVSGVADRESRAPLSRDSRFLAGSVGKLFFAALAMQLVQEERLDLNVPIAHYLGGEPWFDRLPNAHGTTVRMLLNHTSGLVRYEFDPRVTALYTAEPDKVWTPEERLSYLFDTPAAFAPGDRWDYSDTNYIVLAMILERVTGTTAYGEIERRFIAPLRLLNTVPSDRREIPGLVQGYAGPDNPFGGRDAVIENGRLIGNPQMEWAGGGYASAPSDLATWAIALFRGRFHDAGTLAAMLEPVPARGLGQNIGYGLGVIVRPTDLGMSYGHSGFYPGYLSEVRYYPDHDVAVAVQFNTSVGRDIGRGLAAVVHDLAQLATGR